MAHRPRGHRFRSLSTIPALPTQLCGLREPRARADSNAAAAASMGRPTVTRRRPGANARQVRFVGESRRARGRMPADMTLRALQGVDEAERGGLGSFGQVVGAAYRLAQAFEAGLVHRLRGSRRCTREQQVAQQRPVLIAADQFAHVLTAPPRSVIWRERGEHPQGSPSVEKATTGKPGTNGETRTALAGLGRPSQAGRRQLAARRFPRGTTPKGPRDDSGPLVLVAKSGTEPASQI